jgi:hypothetical protein
MGRALPVIKKLYRFNRPGLGFVGIINRLGGYVAIGPAQAGKLDTVKHIKHLRYTLLWQKQLVLFSALTLFLFIVAIFGFYDWRATWRKEQHLNTSN